MTPNFDEILLELSYRVPEGIIDLTKPHQVSKLIEVLKEHKISSPTQLAQKASQWFALLKEAEVVKNKKTGNVYTVKNFNPDVHSKPTPAEIEKEKQSGGLKTEPTPNVFDKEKEKSTKPQLRKLNSEQEEIKNSLNNGDISLVIKASNETNKQRDMGIAGAGGSVPSYGEARLTSAANEFKGGGYEQWKEDNKNLIDIEKKNIVSNAKLNAKKIETISKQLGVSTDRAVEYIAERKVFGDLELKRLEENPDSLWHKGGKQGFGKNEKALRDWTDASFDGAFATLNEVKNGSYIDTSKQYHVIQSNPKEGGVDDSIKTHLYDQLEKAKKSGNSEDIQHYEREVRAFEKLGFNDTMVVGKDSNNRTTVFHITNKKQNNLEDMWANTTPEYMLSVIKSNFGEDVSNNVITTIEDGISKCADGKQATNRVFSSMKFDNDFVKFTEIPEMKPYMDSLRMNKGFQKWASNNNLNLENLSNSEILSSTQRYMKDEEAKGKPVSYSTFGKILTKVGEFAQERKKKEKYSDIDFNSESISLAVKNKNDEKDLVGAVHNDVVSSITEADKQKGFPDKEGNNGPHTSAYISTVMHSMHFDLMVENFDKNLGAVTGIRASRPEDFRGCLAELSDFKGETETKEGRKQLNNHLLKKCRINATTGYIEITNQAGTVSLAEDSWRTSGESKKVEKKLGKGLRQCVASKVDQRKKG